MNFLNWFYDNNTDSVNLICVTIICNLISLININLISIYCYYLCWGNVNTKINKITKNEKQSDYAVSFTHSVGL